MVSYLKYKELFPSRLSFIIFISYILLFVGQGILVTASQKSNKQYDYNIITVVLLTELLKLVISTLLYWRDNATISLISNVYDNRKVLVLYFIPAFLYCLYNNLSFINLSKFDPTTYYLLLQFRVVVTGILFQAIFDKKLSKKQWISLIILTIGCMIKQINFNDNSNDNKNVKIEDQKSYSFDNMSGILIIIQIFCSCLAGVYNEYLLKTKGLNVNIFIQNIFMYLDSIICNLILLIIRKMINSEQNNEAIFSNEIFLKILTNYKVLLVILNNAIIGIVTSFFLKTLNSILKTFASAIELILIAICCYILFNIPIYLNTALSIFIVLYAVYLYTKNPVVNNTCDKQFKQEQSIEQMELLNNKTEEV